MTTRQRKGLRLNPDNDKNILRTIDSAEAIYITMKIGTWNIRSYSGKELEINNEFERAALDLLIMTETKRKVRAYLRMIMDI